MKNIFTTICLLLISTIYSYSQNLLENSTNDWVAGTSGPTDQFSMSGSADQNLRVSEIGPDGTDQVVWNINATGASGMNGGLNHQGVNLDTSKSWRLTFWIKSTGNNNCSNYVGFVPYQTNGARITNTDGVNGSSGAWPYFSYSALPNDKWYLVVGYIHPNGYQGANLGGVYDADTITDSSVLPSPVFISNDFLFPSTESTVNIRGRAFLWSCAAGDDVYVFSPRIEEVGTEVSTIEILSGETTTGGGSTGSTTSVWSKSGANINYTDGNVGIGTTALSDYELAVDGTIRTREVKVDNDNWADYVFKEGYKLPTLEEVQKHITEKGHLINIPSAEEVEANGIELGEMNKLLLEKIEELTLYILEQEKNLEKQEQKGEYLKKQNIILESRLARIEILLSTEKE